MSRSLMDFLRLPLAVMAAAALLCATGSETRAQYGVDSDYYDGAYYDDGYYDDDWYFDYYDDRTGSLMDGEDRVGSTMGDGEEYEYEPGEGYHEEEWYDPSDWFDNDPGVDYETDDWGTGRYNGRDGSNEDRDYYNGGGYFDF